MERNLSLILMCCFALGFVPSAPIWAQTSKVEIVQGAAGFELLKDGEPYYIKGAGAKEHFELLEQSGANSIRLWSTNKAALMDSAHARNMTVTLGLHVNPERTGMDYNDEYAVQGQIEQLKTEVLQYKDHPALIIWGIGNEVDLKYSNPKVWETVEALAKFIKEVDPKHPTMTVIAGLSPSKVFMIKKYCPSIDILGINAYGSIKNAPINIRKYNWNKPYMITEWGVNGPFEARMTSWKAKKEPPNGIKADLRQKRYQEIIKADQEMCLGSYCFLWGQKQESTATWHGMFLNNGCPTEAVDIMHYCWSGIWPENRAASIYSMSMNGIAWNLDHVVSAGTTAELEVDFNPHENAEVTFEIKLFPESQTKKMGGDRQETIVEIPLEIVTEGSNTFSFKAPSQKGAYRVFAFNTTEHGRCSVANIPFLVE